MIRRLVSTSLVALLVLGLLPGPVAAVTNYTVNEDAGPTTLSAVTTGNVQLVSLTKPGTATPNQTALGGTVTIASNKKDVLYTPPANEYSLPGDTNVDAFSYLANNGSTGTITIFLNPVNDAPSFSLTGGATTSLSIVEDAVVDPVRTYTYAAWANVASFSPGPANEAAQVLDSFAVTTTNDSIFATPPTVDKVTGDLSFVVAENAFTGTPVTISVRAKDDGGTANGGTDLSPAATFTLSISGVNDAPTFTGAGDVTVNEDSGAYSAAWMTAVSAGNAFELSQTVTVSVTNVSNTALFSAQPALSLSGTTATLTFTPALNANGSSTVTVRATDNGSPVLFTEATFTITVTAVNDAPTCTAQAIDVAEDGTHTGTLACSDVEGTALTYSIASAAANGTATVTNATTGAFTYAPAVNFSGTDSFTFTASDGSLSASAATVTATVGGANDAPVCSPASITTSEDTASNGILACTDVDSASITRSIVTAPANGTVNLTATTGAYTYTPNLNWSGSDSFTFRGYDGSLYSTTVTVSVTVTAVNDAPTCTTQSFTVAEDGTHTGILACSDVEGSALTIVAGAASNGTATVTDAATGAFTYAPTANWNGTDSFTFTASDGTATSSPAATATATVTAVNDVPSFTKGADVTVAEDSGAYGPTAWATGISSGPANESAQTVGLTVTANSNAALFSAAPAFVVSGTGATLAFTPAANANGSATITVKAVDSGSNTAPNVGESATQTFTITVTAVNDAPTFTAGANVTADSGTTAYSAAWATNVSAGAANESDTLAFTVSNDNNALFATQPDIAADGTLSFVHAGTLGTATVTVSLSDGSLSTTPITFTVTVAPPNAAPTAGNDTLAITAVAPTALAVTANDSSGDTGQQFTIVSTTQPTRGRVTITGGGTGVSYDPTGCLLGADSFTYTIQDAGGLTATATVTLTVAAATSPQVDTPGMRTYAGTTLGSTSVPVRISWCGVVSGASIKNYQVSRRVNGGSWTVVGLYAATTTYLNQTHTIGAQYQYRVTAYDTRTTTRVGSALSLVSPAGKVTRIQDTSTAVRYSGTWGKQFISSASGGTETYSVSSAASASLTFVGRGVAIVAPISLLRGSFDVYLNGVYQGRVNTKISLATVIYRRVVWAKALTYGTHTVVIRPVGDRRIDLDAFLVMS